MTTTETLPFHIDTGLPCNDPECPARHVPSPKVDARPVVKRLDSSRVTRRYRAENAEGYFLVWGWPWGLEIEEIADNDYDYKNVKRHLFPEGTPIENAFAKLGYRVEKG